MSIVKFIYFKSILSIHIGVEYFIIVVDTLIILVLFNLQILSKYIIRLLYGKRKKTSMATNIITVQYKIIIYGLLDCKMETDDDKLRAVCVHV